MATGVVKFFNVTKGFGLIVDDGTGQDVFVAKANLQCTTVREYDRVQFEFSTGKKGLEAVKVYLSP